MAKLDTLFKMLIKENGSDLHLEQGQKPRLRRHGELKAIENEDILSQERILDYMREIAEDRNWNHFEQKGDLDFAYALGEDARFRANYFRHYHGYGAIFRLIPSKILTVEELDLPDIIKDFAHYRSGLVLITGPTGSGKSTTLAAVIDHINDIKYKKIITIEEPVEFIHNNKSSIISHREVGADTQSFASGLRGAIKSDANIILVGEMRDQETIALALKAAEMGILVFGTLHTNSAAKTIDRIIDVFPANQKNQIRTVLANTLKGVVSQTLLKSPDGNRRWVAYEILLWTQALGAIINTGETNKLTSEIQMNGPLGMILLDDCLLQLVRDGKVDKEQAFMKAFDKDNFIKHIQEMESQQ